MTVFCLASAFSTKTVQTKQNDYLLFNKASKGSSLFIRLLKHLKATYRRAKTITLIVDNYIIHKSRETLRWLKANPKFRVIYQPIYSPWVNHVERLWQALHETITRNHQCSSMWQLLKKVHHFMNTVSPFPGGKHGLAKV
ncbi:hypothetical protein DSJ_24000 (plasmid) [Pantoea stewartii subsp. stewartii DC283]|uniref:Tc1-like transposase DDE domain-containing protein n=1 Tax=Pantoea stewartii subsp. stewartii DC283 TaxID=660596 RepID=A0ABN4Z6E9_PANSE|nr:hypothetical protein DSJ_24000 [Pantoea stewartii subsp. stewartii DC283]